jgi:hypothetical protein
MEPTSKQMPQNLPLVLQISAAVEAYLGGKCLASLLLLQHQTQLKIKKLKRRKRNSQYSLSVLSTTNNQTPNQLRSSHLHS